MKKFDRLGRMPLLVSLAILAVACQRPAQTPPESGTVTTPVATTLPDRVLNGPLPGCADAIELVGQSLTIPSLELTLDAGGIVDRVGAVVPSGGSYTFATRPVNPADCSSTTIPSSPSTTVTFGYNYLGDFSRENPLCINGSSIELLSFSVTGTPADALIEPAGREAIWLETDREVATRLNGLLIEGAQPVGANPRCDGWVDLATLPSPSA